MTKFLVQVVALAMAFSFGISLPASAETSRFKSCAALHKVHPSGIAVSKFAARDAVRLGLERPRVAKAVYEAHKKRFDRRGTGHLCTVSAVMTIPTPPADRIETREDSVSDVKPCKVTDQGLSRQLAIGFPVPNGRVRSRGVAAVQVVYVQFPGFPPSPTFGDPGSHFARFSGAADAFYREMSYGNLSLNWRVHPTYVQMPQPVENYRITRSGRGDFRRFMQEAISAADPGVDFSGADIVVIVVNPAVPDGLADVSPAFPLPTWSPFQTAEGPILNGTLLAGDAHRIGEPILTHEIGHLLGLKDLYDLAWRPGEPFERQFPFMGHFDYMNFAPSRSREMTGWHRWLLGWIPDSQVTCLTAPGTTNHVLQAISDGPSGSKLLVAPLSATQVLVAESRRMNTWCAQCRDGVLVTLIDTAKASGNGPIRIIPNPTGVDPMFSDAFLAPGNSLTYAGITIAVTASQGASDLLTISR